MKVTQIIKYVLMAADVVGMAGLFYAGIDTFIDFTPCTDGSCSHRSVQDVVWAIYYMIFAVVITLSLFQLEFIKIAFNFLYTSIGRGIFISFWGTLLLAKSVDFVVGIGIYLIILGAVHITYGFYTWRKKPAPSSQDKYETGINQPVGQQNNAAASDNAQRAQQESAKKKKVKETTTNQQQEPPQDNQDADNNINLSAKKKGAKTKKGYELEEEEA